MLFHNDDYPRRPFILGRNGDNWPWVLLACSFLLIVKGAGLIGAIVVFGFWWVLKNYEAQKDWESACRNPNAGMNPDMVSIVGKQKGFAITDKGVVKIDEEIMQKVNTQAEIREMERRQFLDNFMEYCKACTEYMKVWYTYYDEEYKRLKDEIDYSKRFSSILRIDYVECYAKKNAIDKIQKCINYKTLILNVSKSLKKLLGSANFEKYAYEKINTKLISNLDPVKSYYIYDQDIFVWQLMLDKHNREYEIDVNVAGEYERRDGWVYFGIPDLAIGTIWKEAFENNNNGTALVIMQKYLEYIEKQYENKLDFFDFLSAMPRNIFESKVCKDFFQTNFIPSIIVVEKRLNQSILYEEGKFYQTCAYAPKGLAKEIWDELTI